MKNKHMKAALKQAKIAFYEDEVPIGCVIVHNDKIIARGHNKKEKNQLVTSHAEIIAIEKANKKIGSWRLEECDIYVTLEPCAMCASAIQQARIRNVYFGAYEPKFGALGSLINLYNIEGFNHYPNVEGGLLQEESSRLLKDFFKQKRIAK